MQKKKHYWTQTFIVIALLSCGSGIAYGIARKDSVSQLKIAVTKPALSPPIGAPKYSCRKSLRIEGVPGKRRIESQTHRHDCYCGHLDIGFIVNGVVVGTLALLLTSFIIEYTTTEVKKLCKS